VRIDGYIIALSKLNSRSIKVVAVAVDCSGESQESSRLRPPKFISRPSSTYRATLHVTVSNIITARLG
jgi:hypothetical protein